VPAGARPALRAIECIDMIELFPRAAQYAPARVQETSFSFNAARQITREHAGALVLSREIECAKLLSGKHAQVFVEIHRVPEGRMRRRWLKAVGEHCAGVVAISGGVRYDLIELGVPREKITVEHDAYEAARFAHAPTRERARERIDVARDARLLVYTGGLLEWKGVDVLVDAVRELPDVRLVIAGGMGADVERLRVHARGLNNVRIDGFQPPERVADYLAAADLAVVPNRSQPAISSRYTSPLKVFEAMAVGVPLVASDLPSLRELLTHGVDAWLVAPDDAHALATGITRVLSDDALRARIAGTLAARGARDTAGARARRLLSWFDARLG
jgi:glycosyltransferase involved in cell wall biosynthesis